MKLTFKIWRQLDSKQTGKFETYPMEGLVPHMSLFEALDLLNEQLAADDQIPIEFDHDCREGICGQCGVWINGKAHGPERGTSCQVHLRSFADGDTVVIEPFRAKAFPIKKDLKIDRSAFDRIIAQGGYISVETGQAPEANTIPIAHALVEEAFDAGSCIGCGACVASCKNASAALFVGAKVTQLGMLPQGKPEANMRVTNMVAQMDAEGFGACTLTGACEAACPQEICIVNIVEMNRAFLRR